MVGALAVALLWVSGTAGAPAIAEATHRDVWLGKPPLARQVFDVTLTNPATAPRWLILPSTFPYTGREDPAPGGREIEVQAYRLSSKPRVVIVEGVSAHFLALRLPGGGTVTLRGLAIESWWNEQPDAVTLEVLVARQITVGGTPLAELVSEDPTSAAHADVDARFDAGHPGALPFWHPKAETGAPVTFDVESRGRVRVPLTAGEPASGTP